MNVWYNDHLKKVTKIIIYKAVILNFLLHGFETKITYHHHLQLLSTGTVTIPYSGFTEKTLSPALKSQRQQNYRHPIHALKIHPQLAGHVSRMLNYYHHKTVLYRVHAIGRHGRGTQKRPIDFMRRFFSCCDIAHHHSSF